MCGAVVCVYCCLCLSLSVFVFCDVYACCRCLVLLWSIVLVAIVCVWCCLCPSLCVVVVVCVCWLCVVLLRVWVAGAMFVFGVVCGCRCCCVCLLYVSDVVSICAC